MLMYANQEYDPEDPWEGLFKSRFLVYVGSWCPVVDDFTFTYLLHSGIQAYIYLTELR